MATASTSSSPQRSMDDRPSALKGDSAPSATQRRRPLGKTRRATSIASWRRIYDLPCADVQHCLARRAAKQSILKEVAAAPSTTGSDDWTALNTKSEKGSSSMQRIRDSLSRKRSTWKQVESRGVMEAQQHKDVLQSLNDATKHAIALEEEYSHASSLQDDVASSCSTTSCAASIDSTTIRAHAMLAHARQQHRYHGQHAGQDSRSASRRSSLSSLGASNQTCSAPVEDAILIGDRLQQAFARPIRTKFMHTAVIKIQAFFRGCRCRRHIAKRKQNRRHKASRKANELNQQIKARQQPRHAATTPPPTMTESKRRALERQASEITMSDFGDSTHHSRLLARSSHHTCLSIEEGNEDDLEDEDDHDYDGFEDGCHQAPIAEDGHQYSTTTSLTTTPDRDASTMPTRTPGEGETSTLSSDFDSFESFGQMKRRSRSRSMSQHQNHDYADNLARFEDASSTNRAFHGSATSLPVEISAARYSRFCDKDIKSSMTAAWGHTSFSSYFAPNERMDTPIQRPERRHSPLASKPCKRCQSLQSCTCFKGVSDQQETLAAGPENMTKQQQQQQTSTKDEDEVSLAEPLFGSFDDDCHLEDDEEDDDDDYSIPRLSRMHRSESSLTFFEDLKRRPAQFCRRHSYEDEYQRAHCQGDSRSGPTVDSVSSFSRWNNSVDPTTPSTYPSPLALKQAGISTYHPVCSSSLSPIGDAEIKNLRKASIMHDHQQRQISDGSNTCVMNTVLSKPNPGAETSPPQLPVRKSSKHAVPPAPPPCISSSSDYIHNKMMIRTVEDSPQMPLRKASSHGTAHEPDYFVALKPALCGTSFEATGDAPVKIPQRKLSELPTSHHSASSQVTFVSAASGRPLSPPPPPSVSHLDHTPDEYPSHRQMGHSKLDDDDSFTSTTAPQEDDLVPSPLSSVSPKSTTTSHVGTWIQHRIDNLGRLGDPCQDHQVDAQRSKGKGGSPEPALRHLSSSTTSSTTSNRS